MRRLSFRLVLGLSLLALLVLNGCADLCALTGSCFP